MNAHVERRWARGELDIYLWDRAGRVTMQWLWNGEGWEGVEVDAATDFEKPSLRLQPEVLEAIIRSAEGHVHPQEATVRHLDDVVAVRDRLLTLVEKTASEQAK